MEEILFKTKTVYSIVKITKERIEGASCSWGFDKKKEFSVDISDIQKVYYSNFTPGIIYNSVIIYDKNNNIFDFCYRRKYKNKFEVAKQFLDKINNRNTVSFEKITVNNYFEFMSNCEEINELLIKYYENKISRVKLDKLLSNIVLKYGLSSSKEFFEIESQAYAKEEEENTKIVLAEREQFGIPNYITDSVKLYADGSFYGQFKNEYIIYNNGSRVIFFAIRDCDKNDCLKRFEFNLSDIVYFKKEGNRNVTTEISGGETITKNKGILNQEEIYYLNKALGGKTNNEIIGAMLASKDEKETTPIKTTRHVDDDRKVVLKLKNSEMNFAIDSYNIFLKVIPKKDYEQVLLNNNNSNSGVDFGKNLKDLKKLLDDGLIDESDYTKKKAEILFGQKN